MISNFKKTPEVNNKSKEKSSKMFKSAPKEPQVKKFIRTETLDINEDEI